MLRNSDHPDGSFANNPAIPGKALIGSPDTHARVPSQPGVLLSVSWEPGMSTLQTHRALQTTKENMMSTTAEGRSPLWQPGRGDLEIWYRTLEVYAASAPQDNAHFHGPHVAVPAPLRRVQEGLRWLQANHRSELDAMPLPTLEQMRAELVARSRPSGDMTVLDSGSPCHNLWHWITGS
ncbi:hypothetical protein DMH04_50755 [Kibdelosporangium aridum]|uniref:Uncharacterized protein n=2 Tax=Kibdelosporangium aridum TaxID=2030 RepID=A0A428YBD6_KIBAR|nr:hypothetical protein DMH04_50755 [Kibdelosporangium aridum]